MSVQPYNPHLYPQCIAFIPGVKQEEKMEVVPEQKNLTVADFPAQLVAAIGEERLVQMPQVTVQEQGTGYMDGCFSLDMIPESGAIKGTDQHGRVFVTFAVTNPKYQEVAQDATDRHKPPKETVLFTIFQRYKGDLSFICHRWCDEIPTNDQRFFGGCVMNDDRYNAVKEIFEGRHSDLTLGLKKDQDPLPASQKV